MSGADGEADASTNVRFGRAANSQRSFHPHAVHICRSRSAIRSPAPHGLRSSTLAGRSGVTGSQRPKGIGTSSPACGGDQAAALTFGSPAHDGAPGPRHRQSHCGGPCVRVGTRQSTTEPKGIGGNRKRSGGPGRTKKIVLSQSLILRWDSQSSHYLSMLCIDRCPTGPEPSSRFAARRRAVRDGHSSALTVPQVLRST